MALEANAFVLRRNWWAILSCVAMAVAGVAIIGGSAHYAPLGVFGVLYGVVFAPLLYAWRSFPLKRAVVLRATREALTIGDTVVSSDDVVETKLTRRTGRGSRLDLGLRDGRSLSLRLADPDATALLDLLGARRSAFRLLLPFGTRYLLSVAVMVSLFLASMLKAMAFGTFDPLSMVGAVPACALWALPLALLLGVLRGRVIVGVDGFTTRWLFRDRFTAYRDVQSIMAGPSVRVKLAGGGAKHLHPVETPNTEEERHAEAHALYKYLQESLVRSRHVTAADVPALVRRGDRTPAEWLRGLDELARGGNPGYRVSAVSPELLASVASDPNATSDTRLGAATALIRAGNEAQRVHVRIAAEACAEPDLRDALLAMSDARDDHATQQALARLRRPSS